MPKISVHLEADSAEEFQALLAAFHVKHSVPAEEVGLRRETAVLEYPEYKSPEPTVAPPVESAVAATVPVTVAPEEPVKTRKPRGPNKPKMLPVDETPTPAVQPPVEAPSVSTPEPTPEPQAAIVSRQDLLDAFAEYVQRYGASFGYSDVSKLLQTTFGDGVRKASDVTDANIPMAIGAIRTALADNPYNRKRDYA